MSPNKNRKIKILFAVTQPNEITSFIRDYYAQSRLMVQSLINTGFCREDIVAVSGDVTYLNRMNNDFGICTIIGPERLPDKFDNIIKNNYKSRFFYKPFALSSVDYTFDFNDDKLDICLFDVDGIWKNNPTKYLNKQRTDVWVCRGKIVCNKNLRNKKVECLANHYQNSKFGGRSMANLQIKYGFEWTGVRLASGGFQVKANKFKKLISIWYQISLDAVLDDTYDRGDMETFSVAVCYLKMSYSYPRKYDFLKKYYLHDYTKKNLKKIYSKLWGKLPLN